jgi:hypothetical protein
MYQEGATMDELMRNNTNFAAQMEEWQRVRAERGQDPLDWGEFRQHLIRIGAPDPGSLRPDEFSAYIEQMGGGGSGQADGPPAGRTSA